MAPTLEPFSSPSPHQNVDEGRYPTLHQLCEPRYRAAAPSSKEVSHATAAHSSSPQDRRRRRGETRRRRRRKRRAPAPPHDRHAVTGAGRCADGTTTSAPCTTAITTKNHAAQQYFDQGLRLTWAFNHAAAISSFQEATGAIHMRHVLVGHRPGPRPQHQHADDARP